MEYERIKIKAPGRINVRLGGILQEISIDNLTQKQLKELYENGCRYVGIKGEISSEKKIEVKDINKNVKTNFKKKSK